MNFENSLVLTPAPQEALNISGETLQIDATGPTPPHKSLPDPTTEQPTTPSPQPNNTNANHIRSPKSK